MTDIAASLSAIHARIDAAARCAGRDPSSVRLVAVSKTHTAGDVAAAAGAGQRIFGESRVQEARDKIPQCPPGLEWHFIGHLQKNKVRQALPLFSLFHSIDTEALALAIDRIAGETGRTVHGLCEVNISGESTKHGFSPGRLRGEFALLSGLRHLRITGLMTMAPYSDNPEDARPVFRKLRALRDELQSAHRVALPELSMGMSGDFGAAVEEGATLVRIGTAIFGTRTTATP
ncbi:MAG: YggS family pyridoxal phosphate-dependent enzyme [Chthoniobacterales bacterium]|nr:YggS family pyridoxal phosphate-dependent enzyme [Chthoniobacterales bacterium]